MTSRHLHAAVGDPSPKTDRETQPVAVIIATARRFHCPNRTPRDIRAARGNDFEVRVENRRALSVCTSSVCERSELAVAPRGNSGAADLMRGPTGAIRQDLREPRKTDARRRVSWQGSSRTASDPCPSCLQRDEPIQDAGSFLPMRQSRSATLSPDTSCSEGRAKSTHLAPVHAC